MGLEFVDFPSADLDTNNALSRKAQIEKFNRDLGSDFRRSIITMFESLGSSQEESSRKELEKLEEAGTLEGSARIDALRACGIGVDPPRPLNEEEQKLIDEYGKKISEFKKIHHQVGLSDIPDEMVKARIIGQRGGVRFKFKTTDYKAEVDEVLDRLKNGGCRNADGSVYTYDKAREEIISEKNFGTRWVAN
ncbi:hypothetical protein ACXR0M_19865 [Pseudomonas sp. Eth.TT006]